MKRILYLLSVVPACWQCAQKASNGTAGFRANPRGDSVHVYTLQPDESVPEKSEFVRDIVMGALLFSNGCSYKNLMHCARLQAKQSGANVQYKITSFGKHRFFGKTQKQDSVTLDIQSNTSFISA